MGMDITCAYDHNRYVAVCICINSWLFLICVTGKIHDITQRDQTYLLSC